MAHNPEHRFDGALSDRLLNLRNGAGDAIAEEVGAQIRADADELVGVDLVVVAAGGSGLV